MRNPMNPRQIRRVSLRREDVDCFVFWTKDPRPLMERLGELEGFPFYVQFTLTGYGRDIEPGIPDKWEVLIPAFQRLSRLVGAERVVWRYDPILINDRYTVQYHERAFGEISSQLCGYTDCAVISFVDYYAKNKKNLERLGVRASGGMKMLELAGRLARLAGDRGMKIVSCCEAADLSSAGIEHGSCIDGARIGRITGRALSVRRDRSQRPGCGCLASVDIGAYETCLGGCLYCYASRGGGKRIAGCDAQSPFLWGDF